MQMSLVSDTFCRIVKLCIALAFNTFFVYVKGYLNAVARIMALLGFNIRVDRHVDVSIIQG
jgi:hypothetical protein